jgi:hypothetical protein
MIVHRIIHMGSDVLLVLVAIVAGSGQMQAQSAVDFVRVLTDQSERPGRSALSAVELTCAGNDDDLQAAKSLLQIGLPAVPAIEAAFDSVESSGNQAGSTYVNPWLLYAYARISGAAVAPRLRTMARNPKFHFVHDALDAAVAQSLGLTSWVDDLRVPAVAICRGAEPRDPLDQMILAWERNDPSSFAASLGPAAQAALKSLLGGKTWAEARARFPHEKLGPVGYRLDMVGPWSEAEEDLNDAVTDRRKYVDLTGIPENPRIDVVFTDGSGKACGREQIAFVQTRSGLGPTLYFVNNSDLSGLLLIIASCASRQD